ncbi:hypothetical protein F511_20412 [Dorcoceras hygrometricum]|uniref:Uncharacterized protein n=1 Tax=Dorcoceras hygrometricum TaxID=472368 RepID=A0A2Z7BJ90_9LAMI|nr:hypothetical protein F511_20412 [Dorcoceras hygrometricum]
MFDVAKLSQPRATTTSGTRVLGRQASGTGGWVLILLDVCNHKSQVIGRHECMGKAAMLKAWEEAEEGSLGAAAPSRKVAKKRKASTPAEKEARRQKKKGASTSGAQPAPISKERPASTPPIPTTEKHPDPTPVITIPEVSSPMRGPTKETGPGRVHPLKFFEDSLVVSPSGAVATRFLCHMSPDRDISLLGGATHSEAVGMFASQLASAMASGGEVIKCLTQAHRAANDTRQHFDETLEHCTELKMRLAEVEVMRAKEERAAEAQRVELETQRLRLEVERASLLAEKKALATEKEALGAKKEAIRSELDAALVKKTVVEVELDETKARAAEEIERLKGEATHVWDLGKEEFLKSSEFDNLCAKKSVAFFKTGFESCVAQFRANGYSKEEHPAPFLSVRRALEELPDDDEEANEEDEEEDDADATPPPSPRAPLSLSCI